MFLTHHLIIDYLSTHAPVCENSDVYIQQTKVQEAISSWLIQDVFVCSQNANRWHNSSAITPKYYRLTLCPNSV